MVAYLCMALSLGRVYSPRVFRLTRGERGRGRGRGWGRKRGRKRGRGRERARARSFHIRPGQPPTCARDLAPSPARSLPHSAHFRRAPCDAPLRTRSVEPSQSAVSRQQQPMDTRTSTAPQSTRTDLCVRVRAGAGVRVCVRARLSVRACTRVHVRACVPRAIAWLCEWAAAGGADGQLRGGAPPSHICAGLTRPPTPVGQGRTGPRRAGRSRRIQRPLKSPIG